MKIALITDTHYGVRSDNEVFHENSRQFFENVFFKYIDEHSIRTIIHLGDLVDRRKYININTARRLREDFLEPIDKRGLDFHLIIGNHDTYYKNTNNVNSVNELIVNKYNNFRVYQQNAETVTFGDIPIILIPWICDDNRKQIIEEIKNTKAQIAMGHLEISGFEMYKGSVVSHGDDRASFDKFDMVMSGHFHHRSTDGHIFYLGSHAEFTWSDYNDPRGFHIFDTDTRELTFIENPYKVFKKVYYDDSDSNFTETKIDYSQFKNTFVKVVSKSKNNPYWFDKFIENIEASNPIQLQIVEDHLNLNLEENEQDIVNEAESTLDIFKKYIHSYEIDDVNKDRLTSKIVEIYNEAVDLV
jgi:DNA repair exonuclease SbcCD nuclease subunit